MDYEQLKALIDQRGVHAVFGAPGEGWGIEQEASELAYFLVHMQELGVTSILEVGTGWRAGLARFLHDDMGWEVVSVDIKNYGHHYDGITFLTSEDLLAYNLPVDGFDLVLIDADHSYQGVKTDHATFAPYAAKVIAFHDIAGLRDCEGVADYWREVAKSRFSETTRIGGKDHTELGVRLNPGYYELIADGDQRGGIGYIVLAEVESTPTIKMTGTASKTVDPDASENVTHEWKPEPPVKKPAPRKPAAKKPAAPKKTAVKK